MSITKKRILFIFGTRPEAIKMAPVIKAAKEQSDWCTPLICLTAQHRQMLDQVMDFFDLTADTDLNLMEPDQTLFSITSKALLGLQAVLLELKPDLVLVQGDTTTAFAGALAAFYLKIPVGHIEAGLRSNNLYSPFPEEANRLLIGQLATWHFAPTEAALSHLKKNSVHGYIHLSGNTVIDALLLGLEKVKYNTEIGNRFLFLKPDQRMVLVTGHRRESFGQPFEEICHAMNRLVQQFDDLVIIYPVHLNPNVREPVFRILGNHPRIHLIDPVDYPTMIWLINACYLVITDSGGVQEEAPTLGKPVLVMRNVTERMEGVEVGTAKLVGTSGDVIFQEASLLLSHKEAYDKMANAVNPYGDGKAANHIIATLKNELK